MTDMDQGLGQGLGSRLVLAPDWSWLQTGPGMMLQTGPGMMLQTGPGMVPPAPPWVHPTLPQQHVYPDQHVAGLESVLWALKGT